MRCILAASGNCRGKRLFVDAGGRLVAGAFDPASLLEDLRGRVGVTEPIEE